MKNILPNNEKEFKIVVLINGKSTTLDNLIKYFYEDNPQSSVVIKLVISCKQEENMFLKSRNYLISDTTLIRFTRDSEGDIESIDSYNNRLWRSMHMYIYDLNYDLSDDIDLIVLAGWPHKFIFPKKFKGKVINIHPSMLPAFGGKGMYGDNVHKAVLESGIPLTGTTVHWVNEEYDSGEIIAQVPVEVMPNDTVESLRERVKAAERKIYPLVIEKIASGEIQSKCRR